MSCLKRNIFFYERSMTCAAVDGILTSLKFNKDIKMLPSLPPFRTEYRIQDNGLRWFSSVRRWRLSSRFWKWLRPEFKRPNKLPVSGQRSFPDNAIYRRSAQCSENGRWISERRSDARGEKERQKGREKERENGLGYHRIDRRKGEIRPPSHFRTSVYASSSYRTISLKNAFRAAFLRTVAILFPSNFRYVNFISKI